MNIIDIIQKYKLDKCTFYNDNIYDYVNIVDNGIKFYLKYRNSYVYDDLILIEHNLFNKSSIFIIEKSNIQNAIDQIFIKRLPARTKFYAYDIESYKRISSSFYKLDKNEHVIVTEDNIDKIKLGFLIPYRCKTFINRPNYIYISHNIYNIDLILKEVHIIFKEVHYSISTNAIFKDDIMVYYQFDDNQFDQAETIFNNILMRLRNYMSIRYKQEHIRKE